MVRLSICIVNLILEIDAWSVESGAVGHQFVYTAVEILRFWAVMEMNEFYAPVDGGPHAVDDVGLFGEEVDERCSCGLSWQRRKGVFDLGAAVKLLRR